MNIELVRVTKEEYPKLENIFQLYLHELSAYFKADFNNETCKYEYDLIKYLDNDNNILTLATSDGLEPDQELLFHFMYSEDVTIKTSSITLLATEEGQREFAIPYPFHEYTEKGNKFFLVLGTTYVDRRRYEITQTKIILDEDDAMHLGRALTFFFIYTQDTMYTSSTDIDASSANKYTSIESISVTATIDGQRTFVVPKQDAIMFDKKFFINIGSVFVSEDSYTTNYANNTITLSDNATVSVFAANGQKVYEENNVTSVSLNNLPAAAYIVCVEKNGNVNAYKYRVK